MPSLFRYVRSEVDDLVSDIKSGKLGLPEIQRPFVWDSVKVRDLVDSLYRGYPVGELMLWDGSADSSRSIGKNDKEHSAQQRIVDGQQRLTSLYAVMTGEMVLDDDYQYRSIQIAFNPFTERFEVANAAIRGSADWIANIGDVFAEPIGIIDPFVRNYIDSHGLDDDQYKNLHAEVGAKFQKLYNLRNFPFNVVGIKAEVHPDLVADIFVRINSEGVKLNQADFILTRLSVFWNEGRERLEEFARNSHLTPDLVTERTGIQTNWTPKNYYIAPDAGQLVRVIIAVGQRRGSLESAYNALRGRDPRTGEFQEEYRDREIEKLKGALGHTLKQANWDDFLKTLGRAGFRSRKMISSANALLYTYALWLIGRNEYNVEPAKLRELMARWFFMANITRRYTSSPESRIDNDLARLADAGHAAEDFIDVLDAAISTEFTSDFWSIRLPDALETSSKTSPAYQAYIAALNILDANLFLLDETVRNWMDPNWGSTVKVEEHHLFPRAHLRSLEITGTRRVNQVANYAPTDSDTNKRISARPPSEYWPDLLGQRKISGEALRRQRFWYALPEGWENLGYWEFLQQRRRLMAEVVHQGYLRLLDPGYVPQMGDDLNAWVDDETTRGLRLPDLVDAGLLRPGDILGPVDPERPTVAEITDDALLSFNDEEYDTPARAARADGDESSDGWEYWMLADGDPPRTLRDLAVEYRRMEAEGA